MNIKRTDRKQQRAVQMCGDGVPMEAIARELGVCRRTILRWLADPSSRAEIAKRRRIRKDRFARTVRRKTRVIRAQMEREKQERMAELRVSLGFPP